mmetsp:Transcript_3226/g.4997  ORF Transcript_3226/g.4997 Transcript_3226/m.4997 type:complete len:89 (+) Transcript_3226:16-282(+)
MSLCRGMSAPEILKFKSSASSMRKIFIRSDNSPSKIDSEAKNNRQECERLQMTVDGCGVRSADTMGQRGAFLEMAAKAHSHPGSHFSL